MSRVFNEMVEFKHYDNDEQLEFQFGEEQEDPYGYDDTLDKIDEAANLKVECAGLRNKLRRAEDLNKKLHAMLQVID